MAVNKQFVFWDKDFVPNPFEVLESKIDNYDTKEVPKNMGVYIIEKENNKIYIGKSVDIPERLKSHEADGNIRKDDNFTFFTSEHFNESHIGTLETKLINHSNFFNKKILLNIRKNQKEHQYFNKSNDEKIYSKLLSEFHHNFLEDLVGDDYYTISNTHEYKISPKTKELTYEQFQVIEDISHKLETGVESQIFLITGSPGTGKSVLATKLADTLCKTDKSILLTSGLTNLNAIFKKIFKANEYKNISVKNTGEVINKFYKSNKTYDFIIIDEGHRLKKDKTGKASSLSTQHIKKDNELEDLMKIGKNVILLFDKDQIAMPANIKTKEMLFTLNKSNLPINKYHLLNQMRNDKNFETWIDKMLNSEDNFKNNSSIEIVVHENFKEMYSELKNDKTNSLNTILISTPYLKNNRTENYHFEIDSVRLRWSRKNKNWTETDAAKNLKEVGYVDNTQGKEFESVGLIIGKDFYWESSKLKIDITKNINHFQFIKGETENNHILAINRLRVLLSRATKKIHLYIVDKNLKNHIKKNI